MTKTNRISPRSLFLLSLHPHRRRHGRCVPAFASATTSAATPIFQHRYTYDSNGDDYTTGTNNELTSDGAWSYVYDDEGNRISKTNSAHRELYEWDYRNRLTSVTQQEFNAETQEWTTTQTIEYTYDYNNVWIRKVNGSNSTIFIPENYQTTVQIDNNTVSHHYLWTPQNQDKLLADTTTDGILWSLTDHLGTVRDIIGTTNTHLIYDAFGNLISDTNPILFGYTGKAFDTSTQLQNNINRWYDPAVGHWLSADPIGFYGNDTNLYRYVGNHTLRFVDYRGWIRPDLDTWPVGPDDKPYYIIPARPVPFRNADFEKVTGEKARDPTLTLSRPLFVPLIIYLLQNKV